MRVLHFNLGDYANAGGGAFAVYRLHLGLKKSGVNSKILCKIKTLESPDSVDLCALSGLESLVRKITVKIGLNDIHCFLRARSVKKNQIYLDSDVLSFHAIHSGFLGYFAISSLSKEKKSVLTLHDMWNFTGHCIYSYDCDRWKIGCGKCPYPYTYPAIKKDSTRLEWKLKKWIYKHSNLIVVTPSSWITEQARESMLSRFPIYKIPYGIDTEIYRPLDPGRCKSMLGIPAGKRVLMFGADNLTDPRKGMKLLIKALLNLPDSLKNEILLLTVGRAGEAVTDAVNIETLNLGYVTNDRLKAVAYSASELFIFPTEADNLPLVLLESMACGTPMVSFRVGGVPDLVRPGITGYLAKPGDAEDFCNGITGLLEDERLRDFMSNECRAVAVKEYPLQLQVDRYMDLYSRGSAPQRNFEEQGATAVKPWGSTKLQSC